MKKHRVDHESQIRKPPYTVKSAAKYLNLSTDTIHALIRRGVLRVSTVNPRKFLIPASDVENLVESTCG